MKTKYTALIERYFDNELSPEEIAQVAKLNETEVDFQKEFELFEKANEAIKLLTLSDLKEDIKVLREKQTENTPRFRSLSWIKVAASILLLAVVGVGFYAQQFSNESIYDSSYVPADDYITNMDAEMSAMEKALELYNKKDFSAAIDAFAEIKNTNPENQVAKFYLGQSLLQAGQDEQAIKTLSQVSGDYHPEALWYVALAQLKMDNEAAALQSLERIISENKDEAFVIKAERLKRKLNSSFRKLVL
jgi:TolA-binding protein